MKKRVLSMAIAFCMLISIFSVTAFADSPNITELFANAEKVTASTTFDYMLGTENLFFIDGDNRDVYATVRAVELKKGDILSLSFAGKETSLDTKLMAYTDDPESEGEYVLCFSSDSDNNNGGGESYMLNIAETGTYYIVFRSYSNEQTGLCQAKISLLKKVSFTQMLNSAQALTLPNSVDCELGSGDFYSYDGDNSEFFGVAYSAMLEKDSVLSISFYGKNYSIDTEIRIFQKDSTDPNGFVQVTSSDEDNHDIEDGEIFNWKVPESREYYIALCGDDKNIIGLCQADISAKTSFPLTDALNNAEALTLPTAFAYELGSGEIYKYSEDDGTEHLFYAAAYSVTLEEDTVVNAGFFGKNTSVDTEIWIFQKDSTDPSGFVEVDSFDSDDYSDNYGEIITWTVPADGEYYIVFCGNNQNEAGLCQVIVAAEALGRMLDFTSEPVPEPDEGNLWSWDDETLTLTLQDGFSWFNLVNNETAAILLPDGATVLVKGKVQISNLYSDDSDSDGIVSEGALTIKGEGAEQSYLEINCTEDGLESCGVTVENITLAINSDDDGIACEDGDIVIKNAVLDIVCDSEGIYLDTYDDEPNSELDIIIEDSTIKIVASEEGIQSNSDGDIIITNCDTYIDTSDDEEGIDGDGDLIVTGGKLKVIAYENALEADRVYLSDVIFDLCTTHNYRLIDIDDSTELSLPGVFRLYDADGELLYEGDWYDELYGTMSNGSDALHVDGTEVFRAVSVHEHVYGQDWQYDDNSHWQVCTDENCDAEDMGKADSIAEHTGGTATCSEHMVCSVCGAEYGELLDHTLTYHEAKEATATTDGNIAYWYCSNCDKYFSDAAATEEITLAQTVISSQSVAPTQPGASTNPSTGAGESILLWVMVAMMSGTGILCWIVKNKRTKVNEK